MNKEVKKQYTPTTKDIVVHEIAKNPVLIPVHGVNIQLLNREHAEEVAGLYKGAYERGDFFGNRYKDLSSQVFNPSWFEREISNPDSTWMVFTRQGKLVGATALINEGDPDCKSCVVNIDETQISPEGRGMRIMDYYFRRIVPIVEKLGIDVTTEFVLTPESKGLRRTLQTELGMTALGIHPNILVSRFDGNRKSEISAAKYHNLEPQQAIIMPQFAQLLNIVRQQLPVLPEPEVLLEGEIEVFPSRYADKYMEVSVGAKDPKEQKQALSNGFLPVKYDPKQHEFVMAKYPTKKPDLDFIIGENIKSNTKLVEYLNTKLYPKLRDPVLVMSYGGLAYEL